jgi:hypothetical protein
MNQATSFARLEKLLDALDFRKTVLPSGQIVFRHPPSETMLFFRDDRPDETVSPTDMTVTRRFLDLRGVLDDAKFDRALQDPAA